MSRPLESGIHCVKEVNNDAGGDPGMLWLCEKMICTWYSHEPTWLLGGREDLLTLLDADSTIGGGMYNEDRTT